MSARDLFGIVRPRGLYRPDIDGMRALAVLAVVAFHYSRANFPGGFIGVDIFFVISGYLITGILVRAIEERQFSSFRHLLSDFYQRRIRRIFPSLIVVLLACLVVGWFVLFSSEYGELGKYVAAGAGYVENFVLWNEVGYFNHAAVTKPLLHLWSLAVEEQFYIFWPLLLWVLTRRRWPLLRSIAVIALVTFAFNAWLVMHGHVAHAFYSPLSRTWELMTGAWLAVGHRRGVAWLAKWSRVQAWTGVALIVAGFVLIGPRSAFPGFWALLPVLGAAFIINAGPKTLLNGYVLSWRPAVWVGLISYPLYLWHWVLYSLTVIVFGEGNASSRHATKIVLFVASILLAWLTYRFFEGPIRRSRRGSTSVGLVVTVAALGFAGLVVYLMSGIPDRPASLVSVQAEQYVESIRMSPLAQSGKCFNPQARMTFIQKRKSKSALPKDWYCTLGDANSSVVVLAYGDSHAGALIPALDKYGTHAHVRVVFTAIGSCMALSGLIVRTDYPAACRDITRQTMRFASQTHPRAVIVMEAWTGYLRGGTIRTSTGKKGTDALAFALHKTLEQYQALGIPVVLVEDNPHQPGNAVPKARIRFARNPTDRELNANAITRAQATQQQAKVNAVLESAASQFPSVSTFGVASALCNNEICPWARDQAFLYYDSGHLSISGALQVYPKLEAHMRKVLRNRQ